MKILKPVLEVREVSKTYQKEEMAKRWILDGISFTAVPGEVLIMMGPSGSGKSTLINIITGLERPTSGIIKVKGENILEMGENKLTDMRREMFGLVFQFFELHHGLTCKETIELKMKINKIPVAAHGGNYSHQLLSAVGLSEKADEVIDILSRGEKQRVAIARALVNSPQILIADEPTGALDFETAKEILTLLREKAQQTQSLLIIATHDMNIIKRGDRLLVLEDGRLIEDQSKIS